MQANAETDKDKSAGKRRQREKDDKRAAATSVRAGPVIPDDTDAPIEWSACEECDKWRILPEINGNPYEGKAFKCIMLGDGTTCKTGEEGHYNDTKVKKVRRARIQARKKTMDEAFASLEADAVQTE